MLRKIALATLAVIAILAGVVPAAPPAAALGGPASPPAAAQSAGGSGRWDKLGRTTTNFSQPGLATGAFQDTDLHVLWARSTPGDASLTDLVRTRITASGDVTITDSVVSGWNFIWPVPDLVVSPVDSSLLGIWGGTRSIDPNESNSNISAATSHPVGTGGAWNLQEGDVSEGQGGGSSSIGATMPGDAPLFTWYGTTGVFVHRGLDPSTPDYDFQAPLGGCCGYSPDIASRGTAPAWVAWYSNATGNRGVWAQQVDPATGAPVGSATKMPGSTTLFNGEDQSIQQITRTPIVAGNVVVDGNTYVAYTGGYPSTKKMLVWTITPGGPAADSVVVGKGVSVHTPAVTTDANTRVWVMWSEGGTGTSRIFARRSNVGGTRWGATVAVDLPQDKSGCQTIYQITPETAIDGDVDIIATISEGCGAQVALWHTEIEPGLSLSADPSKFKGKEKVTFKVTDAGKPVQGAKVTIDGESAMTNADGIARIVLGPYAKDQKLVAKATHNGYVGDKVTLRAQD